MHTARPTATHTEPVEQAFGIPADHELEIGVVYRALVTCAGERCEATCVADGKRHTVHLRPDGDPPPSGVSTFEVLEVDSFHTPPRPDGTRFWLDLYIADVRSTEAAESTPPPCG